ncbi:MAG TPA: hypothetical protein VE344_04405 [Methylomirabilota bacterium]|nr:hypothetical protein [Methylomirabilota bacterium]
MNKISRWAGYLASFFSVVLFVTDGFTMQIDFPTPGWMQGIMGICIVFGGCLGVICLVTAFLGRKKSN